MLTSFAVDYGIKSPHCDINLSQIDWPIIVNHSHQ